MTSCLWPWDRRTPAPGVLVFRCGPAAIIIITVAEYAKRLGRREWEAGEVLQWAVGAGTLAAQADGSFDVLAMGSLP